MVMTAEPHDLALAYQRRDSEAVAERFAKCREVPFYAVMALGRALRPAKAGDHLVEDQQRTVAMAQLAQPGQKSVRRLDVLRSLQDQSCNTPVVGRKQRRRPREVIVAESQRQALYILWDAGVHGRRTDRPVIIRKERVVRAQRNEIPAGVRTGEADGGSSGSRAVLGELRHFCTGHNLKQIFGALHLQWRRPCEICTAPYLLDGSGNYLWISVAKRNGAQSHPVFDELVAVSVPDVTTKTFGNESGRQQRILIIAFRIRMRPARYHRMCARTQPIGRSKSIPRFLACGPYRPAKLLCPHGIDAS